MELRLIQHLWNEWFFDDELSEGELLVPEDILEERSTRRDRGEKVKRGLCSVLPESWQKLEAKEHQALRFFLDVWDCISFETQTPALSAFARDVYCFTLSVLRHVPWEEEEAGMQRIERALAKRAVLPQITSAMLAGSWEGITDSKKP